MLSKHFLLQSSLKEMRKSQKLSLKIDKSSTLTNSLYEFSFHSSRFSPLAQIDDQIFIGSYEDASDFGKLREYNITDIINCSPLNCPNNFKEFTYFNFEICDSPSFELVDPMNSIVKLIQKLKSSGKKILIHCYQGISRAPSIAIGYLISCEDKNVEDAIKCVKRNYMKAEPNLGFMIQLEQYYKEMQKERASL